MRVFVTGATGFVGSAVVAELVGAGHEVLGLTRSDAGAGALKAAGAQVHRGSLQDLDSLKRGAAASDGVIHTAFIHDFSDWKGNCETDRGVIEVLGSALAGSDRPLIITSGIGVLQQGRLAVEDSLPVSDATAMPRVATEEAAVLAGSKGINVSLVRLPPSVHGDGDHGFVPMLINIAREKGSSVYIGEGGNRWPSVHRLDAANLYRLVLEKGKAGVNYHAVDDDGVPFRDIAAAIGRGLKLPVVASSPEEAALHFGWFSHFASMDIPASSQKTRELLGWAPKEIGLIEDMDTGTYFK